MRKLIFVLNVAQVRWESAHCIILSIALRPSKFRSERVYTATLGSTERVYTATLGSTERVYMATLGESVHALIWLVLWWVTGCPNKHGNSVTNSLSSLLWISIVIPNFKSHNIIMSARVYFMKTVNGCKDVSIMYPQDEQCMKDKFTLFVYCKVHPYAVKT